MILHCHPWDSCTERRAWAESTERGGTHSGPMGGSRDLRRHAVFPQGTPERDSTGLPPEHLPDPGWAAKAWRCPRSPRRGNEPASHLPGPGEESHSPSTEAGAHPTDSVTGCILSSLLRSSSPIPERYNIPLTPPYKPGPPHRLLEGRDGDREGRGVETKTDQVQQSRVF